MERLLRNLAAGHKDAFAELYDAMAERLYRFLVVRLGSRTDADDALQETFIRLARSPGQFQRIDNLSAYVFTVARNEAIRFAARRMRRRTMETAFDADAAFVCHADDLRQRELADMIAAGLARLTDQQREIVELKSFAGLTFAEIAAVTASPPGTVATRYRTAIGQLRTFCERQQS